MDRLLNIVVIKLCIGLKQILNKVKFMDIPKFEEFFLPVLEFFEDNEIHTKIETSNIWQNILI